MRGSIAVPLGRPVSVGDALMDAWQDRGRTVDRANIQMLLRDVHRECYMGGCFCLSG